MTFAALSAEQFDTVELAAADPFPAELARTVAAYADLIGVGYHAIAIIFAAQSIAAEPMREHFLGLRNLPPIIDDLRFPVEVVTGPNPRAPIPDNLRRRAERDRWR